MARLPRNDTEDLGVLEWSSLGDVTTIITSQPVLTTHCSVFLLAWLTPAGSLLSVASQQLLRESVSSPSLLSSGLTMTSHNNPRTGGKTQYFLLRGPVKMKVRYLNPSWQSDIFTAI